MTAKQIIEALRARGTTYEQMQRITGHPKTAFSKVLNGAQKSLPFEVGRMLELLEMRTRGL